MKPISAILFIYFGALMLIGAPGEPIEPHFKKLLDSANGVSQTNPELGQEIIRVIPEPDTSALEEWNLKYWYTYGEIELHLSNLRKADSLFQLVNRVADRIGNMPYKARAYSALSFLATQQQNAEQAIIYGEQAVALTDSSSPHYPGIMANLGMAYGASGAYLRQLKLLERVQDYYRQEGDSAQIAVLYNNLGLLYLEDLNQDSTALQLFKKAYRINRQLQSRFAMSRNWTNIGLVFNRLKVYDSARYYLEKAVNAKREQAFNPTLANTYFNLGNTILESGAPREALGPLHKSLKISNQYNITPGLFYSNLALGESYLNLEQLDSAQYHLHKAEKAAQHMDDLISSQLLFETQSKLQEQLGNFAEALQYHKRSARYLDSLQSLRYKRELMQVQTDYETRMTRAENRSLRNERKVDRAKLRFNRYLLIGLLVLVVVISTFSLLVYRLSEQRKKLLEERLIYEERLKAQNEDLKRKERKLKQLNQVKDRILSVMGHDLRAPLASISGVLDVLISGDLALDDFKGLGHQLKKDTEITLGTLENILNWARMQDGSEIISKKSENLERLCSRALQALKSIADNKNIALETYLPPDYFVWVDRNQFTSILRNLVINAVKFSPAGSAVRITLQPEGHNDILTVQDEGSGMPQEVIRKLERHEAIESMTGTAGEKGTGIGLRLIHDFVQAHEGQLKIEVNETGTKVSVYFPHAPQV